MALSLELELNEVNVVLGALSTQPYAQVVGVIEKITSQASGQLEDAPVEEPAEA